MDKITVAIIDQNDYVFDKNNMENLRVELEKHLSIVDVEFEHMMELIVTTLGMTNESVGDTVVSYEDDKYVYQMCHLEKETDNKENINGLSKYLTYDHKEVNGKVVFIKSRINDSFVCVPDRVAFDDVYKCMIKHIKHIGLKVNSNDTIEKFEYYNNIFDELNLNRNDYKMCEIKLLGFNVNMLVHINGDYTEEHINRKATKIHGNNRILGQVILFTKTDNDELYDLDNELFNDLLKLSSGSLESRNLTAYDKISEDDEKNSQLQIINNRYCVLKRRLNVYKDQCNHCGTELNKNNHGCVCAGCYRVKYDSTECQRKDWNRHNTECLFNRNYLNIKSH